MNTPKATIMPNFAFFKDMPVSVAAIVALLIVVYYLFRLIFKMLESHRQISEVLSGTNKTLESVKSWIEGLIAAYKDVRR